MTTLHPSMARPPIPGRTRSPGVVLALVVAYLICSVVDLVAEVLGIDSVAMVTQALAMPLLAAVLIAAVRRLDRLIVLVLVALFFSWLGDTVGNGQFLLKIIFFLTAQLAYVIGFWPRRHQSLLFRPWALVGYGALFLALVAILLPQTEVLAVPVVIYGFSVVLMAVLASGLGRPAAIGGLCFVISDSILGVKWFYQPPDARNLTDFAIMFSYLLGQGLLVAGVVLETYRRELRR